MTPCILQQEGSRAEEATSYSTMDTKLCRKPKIGFLEKEHVEQLMTSSASHSPGF